MTPEQYSRLRQDFPALEFPNWSAPTRHFNDPMDWIEGASTNEVLAARFAEVLAGIDCWRDSESKFYCDVPF